MLAYSETPDGGIWHMARKAHQCNQGGPVLPVELRVWADPHINVAPRSARAVPLHVRVVHVAEQPQAAGRDCQARIRPDRCIGALRPQRPRAKDVLEVVRVENKADAEPLLSRLTMQRLRAIHTGHACAALPGGAPCASA